MKIIHIFGGLGALLAVCTHGIAYELGRRSADIPIDGIVEVGYIAPSRLEIECTDLDGNGVKETIMKVGGKPYLLKEEQGKPVIKTYKVEPAKIIQY